MKSINIEDSYIEEIISKIEDQIDLMAHTIAEIFSTVNQMRGER